MNYQFSVHQLTPEDKLWFFEVHLPKNSPFFGVEKLAWHENVYEAAVDWIFERVFLEKFAWRYTFSEVTSFIEVSETSDLKNKKVCDDYILSSLSSSPA